MSRIPNVPERVKEAPAHALRAVFAGIGQALLLSDRMRRKLKSQQEAGDGNGQGAAGIPVSTPGVAKPVAAAAGAQTKPAAPTPASSTAPVASTATAPPAAKAPAARTPAPAAPATAKAPAAKAPAAKASATKAPAAKAPAATARDTAKPSVAPPQAAPRTPPGKTAAPPSAPPIPNYDELSVASLRARLRGLDLAQVRQLLGYEKEHGSRPDVIAMYERRIEKLGQADG